MSSRPVALLVAAVFAGSTTGCLSHEYRIPKRELARLAQMPPETRGQSVRVVQLLGERRAQAIEPAAWAPPPPEAQADGYVSFGVHLYGGGGHSGGGRVPPPRAVHAAQPVPASGGGAPIGPSGAPRPPSRLPSGAVPAKTLPRSGGGGMVPVPSSGKAEELLVLAVIVAAIAVLAATGAAVTEGIRYDGFAEIPPVHPVHLLESDGRERVIPLHALTSADVPHIQEALVMDDEGYGLRFLRRAPLDREGLTFKVDVGMTNFSLDRYSVVGLASNIQLGYFLHQRFGILAGMGLSGATDEQGRAVTLHSAIVEAQAFPVRLGRLHLGLFGNGGLALGGGPELAPVSGPAAGAGLLLEIDLSTRLAFALRGGWTAARFENAWSSAAVVTAGLAIY